MGARHATLGVPGEAEFCGMGVSYCASCDGPFFKNKKMIVVGGGDAAGDVARFLARLSPHISLIHRRDVLRAQKAVADRVLADPAIQVVFNTVVLRIDGKENVEQVLLENTLTNERYSQEADAVFVFTGIIPQTDLLTRSTLKDKIAFNQAGFIITGQDMATALPGLYCVGDLRASPFRQLITAASDGAIAAHSASEYLS
jgi:thioredoxin reductase (NADPH)